MSAIFKSYFLRHGHDRTHVLKGARPKRHYARQSWVLANGEIAPKKGARHAVPLRSAA